jgi:hypothetical protein
VTLDELDIEIHLVKEGVVLSRDSKSSEKFVHGIKVLMAKNYIDNLSEEARKGMQEKAEQGIWHHYHASLWMVRHRHGVLGGGRGTSAGGRARLSSHGRASAAQYRARHPAQPHLHRRTSNGRAAIVEGKRQPLVTRELWHRVQGVLDARNASKLRLGKRDFSFSGLIKCDHCGCALVGEFKKRRYVYYHCTGYKGKCGEPYVREEVIAERFSEVLARLNFGEEVLQWVSTALRESHVDQRKEHGAAIARLQAECERLQNRIRAMHIDKLDGRVGRSFYVQMSEQWRVEQEKLMQEITLHQAADQSTWMRACASSNFPRTRSGCSPNRAPRATPYAEFCTIELDLEEWRASVAFRQPFDLIAQTATLGPGGGAAGGGNPPDTRPL